MAPRLLTDSRRRAVVTAAAFGLLAAATLATGDRAAAAPSCVVSNARTGVGSQTLQGAVAAAQAGDALVVKGTCVGTTTIDKSLTLKGVGTTAAPATLDGQRQGLVLDVVGASVTISGLTITNGGSPVFVGGGIRVGAGATLVLAHSAIVNNAALSPGAGLANYGRLTMTDSTVSGGVAATSGGDIYNEAAAVLTILHSTVTHGWAGDHGGGIFNAGTATIVHSLINDNVAFAGGGIWNAVGGRLTLLDDTITGNAPDNCYPPGTIAGCR